MHTITVHWLLKATAATIPVSGDKVLRKGQESDCNLP